jgi:phenylalanyl-tRNA synthetase beta chain
VDLIEEVARHVGYDGIPLLPAPQGPAGLEGTTRRVEDRCRDLLAAVGHHEAVGYAMVAPGEDDSFVRAGASAGVRLTNPIAEPLTCLRRSLLPGLVRAADQNFRRGVRDVRLFEVGRVFLGGTPGSPPAEPLHLGLLWSGAARPQHWSGEARDVDLFDLMGLVERLLLALEPVASDGTWTREAGTGIGAFHPGRSARWVATNGETVAWGGALHPEAQRRLDHPTWLAEIVLQSFVGRPPGVPQHRALPRYPAVSRDLALVVAADVRYGQILETLRRVPAPAPTEFRTIDRYEGPPLSSGQASLTLRITLQPEDRTLTDPETEEYRATLVRELERRLGVRLRA